MASVRNPLLLERINGPFDGTARTVDVRRIASDRGRYNIGNVAIYLWRLRSYALTNAPAFMLDDRRYLFNPLGAPVRLFQAPMTDDFVEATPSGMNAQMPLGRLHVDADKVARTNQAPFARFYGPGESFVINGVAANAISICNLSDKTDGSWAHMPPAGKVSIDPVLGRIAFGTSPAAAPERPRSTTVSPTISAAANTTAVRPSIRRCSRSSRRPRSRRDCRARSTASASAAPSRSAAAAAWP